MRLVNIETPRMINANPFSQRRKDAKKSNAFFCLKAVLCELAALRENEFISSTDCHSIDKGDGLFQIEEPL